MRFIIAAASLLWALPVLASDTPLYGPPPSWVRENPIPSTEGVEGDRLLLIDRQERLSGAGDEYYVHSAYLVRSHAALAQAGNITLQWNPATQVLTLHKAAIVRGRETIDLLARGQKLTVLRRETNLEQAMLDGTLTGALLAEGLEVGDIVELAYSLKQVDPVLAGKSASVIAGVTMEAERSLVRQIWSETEEFRWRVSRDLEKPKVTTRGGITEISLALEDTKPREVPLQAPRRFHEIGLVEASNFSSWEEVSRLLAPHYDKAAMLDPEGALKAEAKRIMAEHQAPAARTRAALALVQQRMRYLYMGMDAGGYVPTSADQSWARKFGDCKGKTAVLLALLRELGIAARPALVSSQMGDAVPNRLPSLLAFDHVIVRAEVDGRTLWLDGTALDGGPLERVDPVPFRWALPVSAAGGTLEDIGPGLPAFPVVALEVQIDAREGTTLPVPITMSVRFEGRAAAQMKAGLDAMPAEARKEMIEASFERMPQDIEIKDWSTAHDPASGAFTMTLKGIVRMQWQQMAGERRYQLEGETPPLPEVKEEKGPDKDLPVLVHGQWVTERTVILLPEAAEGYRTIGDDYEKKIGGLLIARTARLERDRLVVDKVIRPLSREVSAEEARAARGAISDLQRSTLYLAATGYKVDPREAAAVAAARPKELEDLLVRASSFLDGGELKLALADAEAAVEMEPESGRAIALRGLIKYWMDDREAAKADFDRAAPLAPQEPMWMRGHALLAMSAGDHAAALAAASSAIDIDPEDTFTLGLRFEILKMLARYDEALADLDRLSKLGDNPIQVHADRANLLILAKRPEEAVKLLEDLVEKHPTDSAVRLLLASALHTLERKEEALREYDAVIGLKPTANIYMMRARLAGETDPQRGLADAAAALALDPDHLGALHYRAEQLAKAGDTAAALAELDAAVERKPDDLRLRLVRATTRTKAGRAPDAIEDVRAAKAAAKTPQELNEVCWWGATQDQALELALSACDSALAQEPRSASYLDSRGLVLFRLDRHKEALAAYDAALALEPRMASSLYARSLVKARLNDMSGSRADRTAAIAIYEDVADQYEGYGLKPAESTLQTGATSETAAKPR